MTNIKEKQIFYLCILCDRITTVPFIHYIIMHNSIWSDLLKDEEVNIEKSVKESLFVNIS